MNEIQPMENVLLAEDFESLIKWYCDVLGFHVTRLYEEEYNYCSLETESGIKMGIGSCTQMGIKPQDRSNNTFIFQFSVEDVKALFEHINDNGGTVTFGPSYDENGKFWYGGIADPEGNPIWVVDLNCP